MIAAGFGYSCDSVDYSNNPNALRVCYTTVTYEYNVGSNMIFEICNTLIEHTCTEIFSTLNNLCSDYIGLEIRCH